MIKKLVCLFSLIPTVSFAAPPPTPHLDVSLNGSTVSLSWDGTGASGFRLYYAPYPSAEPVGVVEMGSTTSAQAELPVDTALYVAAAAYNSDGETFSAIKTLRVRGVDVIDLQDSTSTADIVFYLSDGSTYTVFPQETRNVSVVTYMDGQQLYLEQATDNRFWVLRSDNYAVGVSLTGGNFSSSARTTVTDIQTGNQTQIDSTSSPLFGSALTYSSLIYDPCTFETCTPSDASEFSDVISELSSTLETEAQKIISMRDHLVVNGIFEASSAVLSRIGSVAENVEQIKTRVQSNVASLSTISLPSSVLGCDSTGTDSCARVLNESFHKVATEARRLLDSGSIQSFPDLEPIGDDLRLKGDSVSDSDAAVLSDSDMCNLGLADCEQIISAPASYSFTNIALALDGYTPQRGIDICAPFVSEFSLPRPPNNRVFLTGEQFASDNSNRDKKGEWIGCSGFGDQIAEFGINLGQGFTIGALLQTGEGNSLELTEFGNFSINSGLPGGGARMARYKIKEGDDFYTLTGMGFQSSGKDVGTWTLYDGANTVLGTEDRTPATSTSSCRFDDDNCLTGGKVNNVEEGQADPYSCIIGPREIGVGDFCPD